LKQFSNLPDEIRVRENLGPVSACRRAHAFGYSSLGFGHYQLESSVTGVQDDLGHFAGSG
jgi:hypothetical protein